MEPTHLKQSNTCLSFNTTFIGLPAFLNQRIHHESLLFEQYCYSKTIFRDFKIQIFLCFCWCTTITRKLLLTSFISNSTKNKTHPSQGTGKTCYMKAEKSPTTHSFLLLFQQNWGRLQGLGLSLTKIKLSRKARAVYKHTNNYKTVRKIYLK